MDYDETTSLGSRDEPDLCELLSITLQRMDLNSRAANSVADARAC